MEIQFKLFQDIGRQIESKKRVWAWADGSDKSVRRSLQNCLLVLCDGLWSGDQRYMSYWYVLGTEPEGVVYPTIHANVN